LAAAIYAASMSLTRPLRYVAHIGCLFIAAIALSSCVYIPGLFDSSLLVEADGRFEFRYKGQIHFIAAEADLVDRGGRDATWSDIMAYCYDDAGNLKPVSDAQGRPDRSCTVEAVAERKAEWENRRIAQKEEEKAVIRLIGFNPFDEADNHRIAARLMQYEGWKSVIYRGKGLFDVDYQISGTLDRDFLFPMIPGVQIVYPFLTVRKRDNGEIVVEAAGLARSGLETFIKEAGIGNESEKSPLDWTSGTFELRTLNLSLDGNGRLIPTVPAQKDEPQLRIMQWSINPESDQIPLAHITRTR
jgi:hypothetical protein